jgi:hypothetical protein
MDNIEKFGLLKVISSIDLQNRSDSSDAEYIDADVVEVEKNQLSVLDRIESHLLKLNFSISKFISGKLFKNISNSSIENRKVYSVMSKILTNRSSSSSLMLSNTSNSNTGLTTNSSNSNTDFTTNTSNSNTDFTTNSSNSTTTPAAAPNNKRGEGLIPQIPNIKAFTNGILLNILPAKIIKSYVSGIQKLLDELAKIKTNDVEKILEPINLLGTSLSNFANIGLIGSFASLVKLRIFIKGLKMFFKDAGSKDNLKDLKNIDKISDSLSPLEKIAKSLTAFAEIKWTKILISTTALKMFLNSFSKFKTATVEKTADVLSKIAQKIKKPLESLGNSLETFGKKLAPITGSLLKGAIALVVLSTSLIPLAYGLKMFADVKWESIAKGTLALGGLVLLSKALGGATGSILKGAGAIALLGLSIIPLAFSLKMMENIGIGTIGVLAAGLTTLGIAAAAFGSFFPLIALGAGAIALLGASIIPLAFGLKMISEANPEILSSLAGSILEFSSAALLASFGLLIGGAALFPFAAGLTVFGLAVKNFDAETLNALIPALQKLPDVAWSLAKASGALALSGLALIPFAVGVKLLSKAIGDNQTMSDFFSKLGDFSDKINPGKLYDTAKAIITLSGAIAAFGAAQAAEGLGNLVGKFLRFGSDSPLEQMQKFAEISSPLDIASKAIATLADGIGKLSEMSSELSVLTNFPFDELEDLAEEIEGKAIIQIVLNGSAMESKVVDQKGAVVSGISGENTTLSSTNYSSTDIMPVPSQIGSTLSTVGPPTSSSGAIIVNNNSGGNVSNVSSSNVNNMSSAPAPIVTGSAMSLF